MDTNPVGLGATRDELRQLLGEPTDSSVPSRREREPGIWKYREIEYHFDNDGRVFLIYTEDEDRNPRVLGEIRRDSREAYDRVLSKVPAAPLLPGDEIKGA